MSKFIFDREDCFSFYFLRRENDNKKSVCETYSITLLRFYFFLVDKNCKTLLQLHISRCATSPSRFFLSFSFLYRDVQRIRTSLCIIMYVDEIDMYDILRSLVSGLIFFVEWRNRNIIVCYERKFSLIISKPFGIKQEMILSFIFIVSMLHPRQADIYRVN